MTAAEALRNGAKSRVLCIIKTIDFGGGAEQLLTGLLPEMRRHGYDCELVALCDWPNDIGHILERQGIMVHRLRLAHEWKLLTTMRKLYALFSTRPYDLVWGHMFAGNAYATLLGLSNPATKSVITLHTEGYSQSPPKSLRRRVFVFIEKLLLTQATAKAAVSASVASDFESYFGWSDIAVIHNGVVTSMIPALPDDEQRANIRAAHGVSVSDFLIVTPPRFVPKKGHSVLLEALAILKREKSWCPRLVACGFVTPLLDRLRLQAARLDLMDDIEFSPAVPQDQLFPLIQAADAVVIPSLREPFGIAAAEAMLLGAPVVLTRADGFVELVGNTECALMVPPGDSASLAEAIWTLHTDPDVRRRLIKCGRSRIVENFDMSRCASKWARLFDRVMQAAPKQLITR
jgi:glycosyltransferase involved in cell wall biosynthesis